MSWWPQNDDVTTNETNEVNETVTNMMVPMVGLSSILVGHHCLKYLCKEPCRTGELSGSKWVHDILHGNKVRCNEMFRMEPDVFTLFCSALVNNGLSGTKGMGIHEMVGMFLYVLGHGVGNRVIQERFQHSGETVSRHFHLVLAACLRLSKVLVRPQEYTFEYVKTKICNDTRYWPYFQDCIRAIDGTHVPCVVPTEESGKFIGRKGYTTQNVMVVCDWEMFFTFALPGWEGYAHDARVFNDALTKPEYNFPHPPNGKYYLVDSGYPTPEGYLGSYKREMYHLPEFRHAGRFNNYNEVFKYFHSSLRSTIERTFGVWKNRFAILRQMPKFKYKTQVEIVYASMAIHNFIRRYSASDIEFQNLDGDYVDPDEVHNHNNNSQSIDVDVGSSLQMNVIRDSIRDSIVTARFDN